MLGKLASAGAGAGAGAGVPMFAFHLTSGPVPFVVAVFRVHLTQSTQSASTSVTGFAFCKSPVRTDLSFEQLSGDSFAHVIAIDQAGAGSGSTYLHKVRWEVRC